MYDGVKGEVRHVQHNVETKIFGINKNGISDGWRERWKEGRETKEAENIEFKKKLFSLVVLLVEDLDPRKDTNAREEAISSLNSPWDHDEIRQKPF